MSGGWTPAVHLFSQSRGKLDLDEAAQSFVPGKSAQAERSAGACNGTFGLAGGLRGGLRRRERAAAERGRAGKPFAATRERGPAVQRVRGLPTDRNATAVKAFVDFQNDVTAKDIRLAVREGFESIEHVKRYTTTGMATDQGKTSNMNGLASPPMPRTPAPAVGTHHLPACPTRR